jgi:hypothetical protein
VHLLLLLSVGCDLSLEDVVVLLLVLLSVRDLIRLELFKLREHLLSLDFNKPQVLFLSLDGGFIKN